MRQWGLADDATETMHAQVYESFMQRPDRLMGLMAQGSHVYLRTKEGVAPASVLPAIRNKLAQFNSETVAFEPEPMETIVADSIARQRFTMILFTGFAVVALLLASVGIYGVLSYVVGQRTQEIGIRMALGAQRGDVLRAFLRDGARLTLIGIAAGGAAALGLTRLMSSILFDVKPTDPLTFGGVALVALRHCVAGLLHSSPARSLARSDAGPAVGVGSRASVGGSAVSLICHHEVALATEGSAFLSTTTIHCLYGIAGHFSVWKYRLALLRSEIAVSQPPRAASLVMDSWAGFTVGFVLSQVLLPLLGRQVTIQTRTRLLDKVLRAKQVTAYQHVFVISCRGRGEVLPVRAESDRSNHVRMIQPH